MAQVSLNLSFQFRWWVRPLMFVFAVGFTASAPFLTEEQAETASGRLAHWVAERGTVITVR